MLSLNSLSFVPVTNRPLSILLLYSPFVPPDPPHLFCPPSWAFLFFLSRERLQSGVVSVLQRSLQQLSADSDEAESVRAFFSLVDAVVQGGRPPTEAGKRPFLTPRKIFFLGTESTRTLKMGELRLWSGGRRNNAKVHATTGEGNPSILILQLLMLSFLSETENRGHRKEQGGVAWSLLPSR